MPLPRPGVLNAAPAWGCRLLAALLILGAAAAHLLYLSVHCPLDLAPDEAHYWDWSRHLDWSYYSKGPLVAWLIRASCELFGDASVRLTGSLMPAVRLPAVVCSTLLLVSLYILTRQTFRCERLAVLGVAAALTLPVISVGASIMTIDAPYTCCWGWALVFAHRAVFRDSLTAWVLTGLAVGLGILAKYTMVLFVPSLALFLLTTPAYRGLLWRRGFWSMCAVAALCCTPILIWNAQHGWVTVLHVIGLTGFADGPKDEPSFYWSGPFVLFGSQAALLLVFWFVCWLSAMVIHRPTREQDPDCRYLWWLSAPMFAVFLAFSFKTGGGEVNWPVTTYLSGLVLAAPWLVRQLASARTFYRRWSYTTLTVACVGGMTLSVFMHRTDLLYPLLSRLTGPETQQNPYPLRKLDPSCRLRGWQDLGKEVDRVRQRVRDEEGAEPILAGCGWAMPGELGFYCEGHPPAYSLGLSMGDRHSQYDLWHNPLDDVKSFRGRTFLVVGASNRQRLTEGFERVEEAGRYVHRVDGHSLSEWQFLICRGYKGLKPQDEEHH
jgi:hypothetical protein